jgi:hypothetical protein
MAEWSTYDFSTVDRWHAVPLDRVFHIAHVKHARQILEEGRIAARPVYDESRLNKSRIHVVWLSPNDWTNGSFYGNVRFQFDWGEIIRRKQIYWVEAIKYSPHAPRFLITDRDPKLLAIDSDVWDYDPRTDDGPLKHVGANWFWNGRITLELMLEQDIHLRDCVRADVVKHHHRICRIYGGGCKEVRRDISEAGAELLGYLVGAACHEIDDAITSDIGLPDNQRYHSDLQFPVMWLKGKLFKGVNFTGPIKSKNNAASLIRAACLQVAFGDLDSAKATMALIGSEDVATNSLEEIIQTHFGLQGVNVLFR